VLVLYLGLGEVFEGVVDLRLDELDFNKHQFIIDLSDVLEERLKDFKTLLVFFLFY
jgi:hypothetical protein